jgi:hypothetical protein
MPRKYFLVVFFAALVTLLPGVAGAQPFKLAEGLAGASGSTVGPDGALYVTEAVHGRISRVDPWTGDVTTFAEGLPEQLPWVGLGGAMDVAFVDGVAYVLVTLVDFWVGGSETVGIYRLETSGEFSVMADIGVFSSDNPPTIIFEYFVPSGVQYAMEPFRGGFLVSDGHHNRVLWISPTGIVSEFKALDNIVPTGLEVHGKTVYMAQAGELPHDPEDGSAVVAIDAQSGSVQHVGSGAPLLVDVEFGLGRSLYALAQGEWNGYFGTDPGTPADPDGGSLSRINPDGSFTEIAGELNLPTSMEFIGNAAFIVNLAGEIWVIEDVSAPPFGREGKTN